MVKPSRTAVSTSRAATKKKMATETLTHTHIAANGAPMPVPAAAPRPPRLRSEPYVFNTDLKGYLKGLTYFTPENEPIAHYFGGVPYAMPPVGAYRFRQARPLPPCYRYGSAAHPGDFTGKAGVCPQPGFEIDSRKKAPEVIDGDEDCLQVNMWVPVGEPPEGGWPVVFFIHGGFLQFGSPNSTNLTNLLTHFKAIFVLPAYRLNALGFLSHSALVEEAAIENSPCGNFGFWDQRLALEWAWKHVSYFGGDASNISIMGHSAGAYSVFHQLAHDLAQPKAKSIIKRALMISNGPGLQPRSPAAAHAQAEELFAALGISLELPGAEILQRLRETPAPKIVQAASHIQTTEFRAFSDGEFVDTQLFAEIDDGRFAKRLADRGVRLLLGELPDENTLYQEWRTPTVEGQAALSRRLRAEYPTHAVQRLVKEEYFRGSSSDRDMPPVLAGRVMSNPGDWTEAFGRCYADLQVHALQRGLLDRLVAGGAGEHVARYRIEWRAKVCDRGFPRRMGVTHGSDLLGVWFYGGRYGTLTDEEQDIVRGFVGRVWEWFEGKSVDNVGDGRDGWLLNKDGDVETWRDDERAWTRGVRVWKTVREAQVWEEKRQRL